MANKSIKGTQTEKNLVIAYLAESSAYTRYTFYAQQADKENYYPIGEIFRQTAANELHHAKIYFKFLEGGSVEVPVSADAGVIGDTASNLQTAADEEMAEGVDLYIKFAETAEKEGFPEIASHFRAIATIEKRHHDRFVAYLEQVKAGTVWKREKPIQWQCLVCGYVYEGVEPPKVCPGCDHPYQHYIALDMDQL
ncbi:MAG: rubrerythrin family protein [Duncaniella sp.]|nr:rubrerythrin family protein [Bacteroides sp.]MDE5827718.1 rubrerythrin family protein [Duncaniella sp.]MBD5299980.1 rubrerythrin family protein [Bacteroides sp.]MBD5317835.1 rubrerythrin family protein [Bacteroides sp.]MBD5353590.1 rubrerythrin family protein [Bacteroides sp.]